MRGSGFVSADTAGDGPETRIVPGRRGQLQMRRTGARKLFDEAAQRDFLEWFAATCNVSFSASQAGFNYKTVLRHRMNDPRFAEGWDRAVRQGYARLEAQQLETRASEAPIGIEGDRDAPAMQEIDPQVAILLLREHKREIAGVRKPGRAPQVASNEEVRAALVKRLAAFGVRVSSGDGSPAGEEGVPVAAQPAPPPPCGWSPSPAKAGED